MNPGGDTAIGRADLGQQQPAGRRRPGRRPVSGPVRRRPTQPGVQVPAEGPRRRRPGRHRRPHPHRPQATEVRLPQLPERRRPARSTTASTDRPRDGRTVRPAGPRPLRHPRCRRAARRLPQVGRGALSLPRGRDRRPGVRLLHARPARAPAELREPARRRTADARRHSTSFAEGKYDRTPVGDLLPVYLDRPTPAAGNAEYRSCSPARAGSSRGSGCGRRRTRSRSGWATCPPCWSSTSPGASSPGP